jgi:hypothetical protein
MKKRIVFSTITFSLFGWCYGDCGSE